jgi:hypothetical protein
MLPEVGATLIHRFGRALGAAQTGEFASQFLRFCKMVGDSAALLCRSSKTNAMRQPSEF